MRLRADTYVVLDVPEPFASQVVQSRRRSGDEFRASLPAEITLIGSGGVGCVSQRQPVEQLVGRVRTAGLSTGQIETSFGPPLRFANSDVFVFPLLPCEQIVELHKRLRDAGLLCRVSPWPYVPHCTIRSRSPVSEKEASAILEERVEGRFILTSISIYTTDRLPDLALIERVDLKPAAQQR